MADRADTTNELDISKENEILKLQLDNSLRDLADSVRSELEYQKVIKDQREKIMMLKSQIEKLKNDMLKGKNT